MLGQAVGKAASCLYHYYSEVERSLRLTFITHEPQSRGSCYRSSCDCGLYIVLRARDTDAQPNCLIIIIQITFHKQFF